jgi:DNA-binding transcriptional MerR regulator
LDDATSRTQARGTLSIEQIRDLLIRLNKEWQRLDSFGLPVEKNKVEEASRLIEMLRNELNRLQKNKTLTILSLTAAAAVVLIISGWWMVIQYRAGELKHELEVRCQARSLGSVKKLISDAGQSSLPRFSSSLTAEIASCSKWLEATEKECNECSLALKELLSRASNFAKEDPIRLDEEYQRLVGRLKQLPDEQQKLLQPEVMKLDKYYSDHLASLGSTDDKELQLMLDDFDKASEPLQKTGLSLKEIQEILKIQKGLAEKWASLIHSPIKDLPINDTLKAKADVNEAKIKELSGTIKEIENALDGMDKAANLETFRNSLGTLKQINLPCCSLIPLARIAWNTDCTPDTLLPELLFPGKPEAYLSLKQAKTSDSESRLLFPKTILPQEVAPFSILLNDEMTPDVKVYSLEGGEPSRTVYSKSEIKTTVDDGENATFFGKTYDPQKDSTSSPSFTLKQYLTSGKGWQKVKKLTGGEDSAASKIYHDLGLKDVVSDSMEVHISPLQLLERMTQSESKDPIYEAFVIQQLLSMTSSRPYAWGLQYSPGATSLMHDVDELIRINCGNLTQGSWMTPAAQKLAPQLKVLLDKPYHFNGEAELNKLLAEQIVNADVFCYAGYVGADGKAHLSPDLTIAPHDLYGITGAPDARKAACIFRSQKGSQSPDYEEVAKPIVFTPLYGLKNGRQNMLDSAVHALRLEQFRNELVIPPLFQEPVATTVQK